MGAWSWLELLQRCRVGQVQSWSCAEWSRMWSCAQSSKLHHIPQMRLCRLCICQFVSFGCSKNIEKWYCISITNPKQNFPTLNELFVPGCWFFASSPTPSVSDHAMPCTRLHHLKTWHCGSERQEIIFGLRWMLGNLWKFDLYVSIKTGFDDLCFYGVQSPIKNFCHPSWRWILSPFSLWNVSFCHIPWLLE